MKAETILRGGVFPTVPEADSLAMEKERILAIGKEVEIAPLAAETTRIIELNGKAILPGFIDAHTHFFQIGLKEIGLRVDLSELSRAETLARLAEALHQRGKGEWVIGQGWDESTWQERHYLSRSELDRIAPNSPLIAVRVDGHLLSANSCALKQIPPNVDQKLVDFSSGTLREEAAFTYLRAIKPDHQTQREALHAAVATAYRFGITSVHTMLPADRIRLYMRERGRFRLRVTLCPEILI